MGNEYPPGTTRATFREVQHYKTPKFRVWCETYANYWLNEGAKAQWAILKAALKAVYGFGPVRIKRLEAWMCAELEKEKKNGYYL